MVRFVCPDVEVRLAGGREIHLRTLQPLALHLVNSIFLGDYLTSEGQAGKADLDMITDAGFEVEGSQTTTLPEHRRPESCGSHDGGACGSHDGAGACGSHAGGGVCGSHDRADSSHDRAAKEPVAAGAAAGAVPAAPAARTDLVSVRRRGAGTDLPPNA